MSALSISSIRRTTRSSAVEGLPQLAALDIGLDILDFPVTQLAVAQPADGIVFIKPLGGSRGGFDVPFDDVQPKRGSHLFGQFGLARSGLALDQKRAFQKDRGIDRNRQIVRGDIALGALKPHTCLVFPVLGTADPSLDKFPLQGRTDRVVTSQFRIGYPPRNRGANRPSTVTSPLDPGCLE